MYLFEDLLLLYVDCEDGFICGPWGECTAPCGGTGIETRGCDTGTTGVCPLERECQGPPCSSKSPVLESDKSLHIKRIFIQFFNEAQNKCICIH